MLVLARQLNERVVLPTVQATIEVVALRPTNVRLGFTAPPEVLILREEVLHRETSPAPVRATADEPDAEARLSGIRLVLRNRLAVLGAGLRLVHEQLHGAEASLVAMLVRMEGELLSLDQQLQAALGRAQGDDTTTPSLVVTG